MTPLGCTDTGDYGRQLIQNAPKGGEGTMELRSLGRGGLKVSALGLGCMAYGQKIETIEKAGSYSFPA